MQDIFIILREQDYGAILFAGLSPCYRARILVQLAAMAARARRALLRRAL